MERKRCKQVKVVSEATKRKIRIVLEMQNVMAGGREQEDNR